MNFIFIALITLGYCNMAIGFNTKEGSELLTTALTTICRPSAAFDKPCLTKFIKSYFSLFDLCKYNASNCGICTDQDAYIANKIVKNLNKTLFKIEDIPEIAVMMALSIAEESISCSTENSGVYSYYLTRGLQNSYVNKGAVVYTDSVYKLQNPKMNMTKFPKCIDFGDLVAESELQSTTNATVFVPPVLGFFVLHQMAGFAMSKNCSFSPPYGQMMTSLFQFMGLSDKSQPIHKTNLERLTSALKIGVMVGANNTTTLPKTDGHDHSHGQYTRRHKRDLSETVLVRRKRATTGPNSCVSVAGLYASSGLDPTLPITLTQFQLMMPLLLQQAATNACIAAPTAATNSTVKPLSVAEKWGWSTLAVLIICLCSILGILVIPFGQKKIYNYLIVTFVGLGVGSLLGDAVLHLIPQVIGVHSHDPAVIGLLIGVLLSFLFMYILESSFVLFERHNKSNPCKVPVMLETYTKNGGQLSKNNAFSTSIRKCQISEDPWEKKSDKPVSSSLKKNDVDDVEKAPMSAAVMVILGDAIHNTADGLALGAAFSISLSQGLALSIAVLCHELPHEFGDFAVLLSTGMRWRWALLANGLSSLTAFVGLYIGLAVAQNSELAQKCILAVAAGIFLYVALCDMIPVMIRYTNYFSLLMFFLGLLGIVLGLGIMIIIAFFEENIKV